MYGRADAGTSSTIATHHAIAATKATVATASCQIRRHHPVGAASRYTRPNAGSTSTAWSIFVRNPRPTRAKAMYSHLPCASSSALVMQ
jgi:hypothetical protein